MNNFEIPGEYWWPIGKERFINYITEEEHDLLKEKYQKAIEALKFYALRKNLCTSYNPHHSEHYISEVDNPETREGWWSYGKKAKEILRELGEIDDNFVDNSFPEPIKLF